MGLFNITNQNLIFWDLLFVGVNIFFQITSIVAIRGKQTTVRDFCGVEYGIGLITFIIQGILIFLLITVFLTKSKTQDLDLDLDDNPKPNSNSGPVSSEDLNDNIELNLFERIATFDPGLNLNLEIQIYIALLLIIPLTTFVFTTSIDGVLRGESCFAESGPKRGLYVLILINLLILVLTVRYIYYKPVAGYESIIKLVEEKTVGVYKKLKRYKINFEEVNPNPNSNLNLNSNTNSNTVNEKDVDDVEDEEFTRKPYDNVYEKPFVESFLNI